MKAPILTAGGPTPPRSTLHLTVLLLLLTLGGGSLSTPSASSVDGYGVPDTSKREAKAIEDVIDVAYIKGIHTHQDALMAHSGFHPDFAMLVQHGNDIRKVTVDEWLESIKAQRASSVGHLEVETSCRFELVDVTADAAVAKLQVYKGSKHFSTDYMLLYRFDDGWKIVSKIFKLW